MPEWVPTGRSSMGPTARQVEVAHAGELYTALVLHAELREPRALQPLVLALGFLEAPDIYGLAPLVQLSIDQGRLVYRTGPVWPLAQVLPAVASAFGPCPRAACELAAEVAPALERAALAGAEVGLHAHGSLSPWTLALDEDGEPLVLGYGLPPLELRATDLKPDAASWRYCPPERVRGDVEGLGSDLFALALVASELAIGRPVYTGDAEAVRLSTHRGRARELVHGLRMELDPELCDALEQGLHVDPDTRWSSGRSMADTFRDLAESPMLGGPDLAELMAWVRAHVPDGPRPVPAEAAGDDTASSEARRVARTVAPEPEAPRWIRPERRHMASSSSGSASARVPRVPPDHNAMYPHDPMGPSAIRVRVSHGDQTQWAKIDRAESLAKSAARLVDQIEVSPVDLTGRIRGWYRIAQGEDAWYGDERTEVLDPDRPIELDFVENRVVSAILEVEGEQGEEPYEVEVGTAVHGQFLVGELRRLLELPGTWRLEVEGAEMDPWQILDDWEPRDGLRMRLCRVRRGRR